jgi:hypothetical protein
MLAAAVPYGESEVCSPRKCTAGVALGETLAPSPEEGSGDMVMNAAALESAKCAAAGGTPATEAGAPGFCSVTRPHCVPPLPLTRASMEEVDTILHLLEHAELPSTLTSCMGSPRRLQQQHQQQQDAGGALCLNCNVDSNSISNMGGNGINLNENGSVQLRSQAGTPRRMGAAAGEWVQELPDQGRHQHEQLQRDQKEMLVGAGVANGFWQQQQQQSCSSPRQLLSSAQRRRTTTDIGILRAQRGPCGTLSVTAGSSAAALARGSGPGCGTVSPGPGAGAMNPTRRVSSTDSPDAGGSRTQTASLGGGIKGLRGSRPVSSSSGGSRGGGGGSGARSSNGGGGGGSNGVPPEVLLAREWQSQGLHWQQSLRTGGIASLMTSRPLKSMPAAVFAGPSSMFPSAAGGAIAAGRGATGCVSGLEAACWTSSDAAPLGNGTGATVGEVGATDGDVLNGSMYKAAGGRTCTNTRSTFDGGLTPTGRPQSSRRQGASEAFGGVVDNGGSRPALPRIRALSWGTSSRKRN